MADLVEMPLKSPCLGSQFAGHYQGF